MPAHLPSVYGSSSRNLTSSDAQEDSSGTHASGGGLTGIESRENVIRNAARKWFGPLEVLDPAARASERARHEAIVQTLLRLHRLSCNLVPEQQRIPLAEQDIFSAIKVLNRIAVTVKGTPAAIASYCEARAVRERSPFINQLDPLQLRHLLSFHQDIPHEELNALDIHTLKSACEKSAKAGIQLWFETIARRKAALPKGAPQFLRQLTVDLWNAGHHDFLDCFATELAVLDSAMFDALGWENSRLFLAVFKRIHGSACRPASVFLDAEDIDVALEMYKRLEDADQVVHFRALSTTYDAQTLRRLELTIISAAKECGSRTRIVHASPLDLKNSVPYPTLSNIPVIFAPKYLRPASQG